MECQYMIPFVFHINFIKVWNDFTFMQKGVDK